MSPPFGGMQWSFSHRVVLFLSLAAIAVAVGLVHLDAAALEFVLGRLDPVLVTIGACLLGLGALSVLLGTGWIPRTGGTRRGFLVAVVLGMVLTAPAILLDLSGGFPRDINIDAPQAYFAYPAIALVAEFVFHVVPMGAVAFLIRRGRERFPHARQAASGLATLPEPILQVAWGAGHAPLWVDLVVGPHLFLFNVVEVLLLTRNGFLTAYTLRLAYYAIWHVAWGQVRLGLLLPGPLGELAP